MNEKERIIELVKNNIISMDEALQLLEAAAENPSESKNIEEKVSPEETIIKDQPVLSKTETNEQPANKFFDILIDTGSTVVKAVTQAGSMVIREINEAAQAKNEEVQYEDYVQHAPEGTTIKVKDKDAEPGSEEISYIIRKNPVTGEREFINEVTGEKAAEVDINRLFQEVEHQEQSDEKDVMSQIDQLNEELHKINEQIIIAQQRLRELEIFAEIDELTPEMLEQQAELKEEQAQLNTALEALASELDILYDSQTNPSKSAAERASETASFKEVFEDSSTRLSEMASSIGREAGREGKRLGRQVQSFVKSALNNFSSKDVNLSFNVPWVKSEVIHHRYTFKADELKEIDIDFLNGDAVIESYSGEDIIIDAELSFYGNHETLTPEAFEKLSTMEIVDQRFVLHVKTPKLSMTAHIQLPEATYDLVKVNLLNGKTSLNNIQGKKAVVNLKNGDITGTDLDIDELDIDTKLGNISLEDVKAQLIDLDLVNGDVYLNQVESKTVSVRNINGDFRISGPVGDIKANTVNSDFYITKLDDAPAHIAIESMHGDIKVSIPEDLDFETFAKSTMGSVQHRMAGLEIETILEEKKTHLMRNQHNLGPVVEMDLALTSGDVYLKDN